MGCPNIKRISPSAAGLWDRCHAAWTLKYVFKVPYEIENKSAINFGNWIHSIFEHASKDDRYDIEHLKHIAMRERPLHGTIDQDKLALTEKSLNNFSGWYGNLRAQNVEPVGQEWKFSEKLNVNGDTVFGIIDLVMQHKPSGRYLIIDYKTSKRPSQTKYLQHDVQMQSYAAVASRRYGVPVSDLAVAHYQPHLDRQTKVEYDTRDDDIFVANFTKRLDAIRERGDVLEYMPNNLCGWCDYKHLCPMEGGSAEKMDALMELAVPARESGTNMKKFWEDKREIWAV